MTQEMPVLHILVVGFHHKKGCQVEFSYPPLVSGKEATACPSGWKYLPTLALPDGSHNFVEDSVFFNLPSLTDPNDTVFGISCYRQIPVENLKIRTADVTRSTVQKSVCALTSIPVYGYIEVKLSLIAHAFFDQGDFSCTEILVKAFDQLNACLSNGFTSVPPVQPINHMFVGLPLRDIILRWRYKSLILFKLMLLQKRVVCFGSPVRPICSLILGIASLHPELLGKGFQQVACVRTSRPLSPMPNFSDKLVTPSISITTDETVEEGEEPEILNTTNVEKSTIEDEIYEKKQNKHEIEKRLDKNSLPRDASVDALASSLLPLCSVPPKIWGAPLPIFTSGNMCLPYLSLPYMDLLTDPSVLGYTIGTSNILFQQKKQLTDVLVDVEGGTVETPDQELKRQLTLTTEDLRFVDYIIRHVQTPKEDAEGSEHWIRDQFQGYMLAMLRTSMLADGSKEIEHFNGSFMGIWKKTNCYKEWSQLNKPDETILEGIPCGHPFAGTLSVADMKLKISQTMNNSESGRKLNQAVNTTSRAVGGALSQAKGALTNWWSSLSTQQSHPQQHTMSTSQDNSPVDDDKHTKKDSMNSTNIDNVIELKNDKNEINFEHRQNDLVKLNEGIIEIGKEAEVLDTKRMSGEALAV